MSDTLKTDIADKFYVVRSDGGQTYTPMEFCDIDHAKAAADYLHELFPKDSISIVNGK